jgi:hypothetical protein
MSRKETSLSIVSIISILTVSLAVATLREFGTFGMAQSQADITPELTPEQKAAICDPNNPSSKLDFVNTTESTICGIPKTITNTTTTEEAANNTTTMGTETPSSSPGTSIAPSDTSSSSTTTSSSNQSPLYEQGYAKGVADAKSVQSMSPPSTTMTPDDVDCDSSIDPKASNADYCSGYQHGFADTNNNALSVK